MASCDCEYTGPDVEVADPPKPWDRLRPSKRPPMGDGTVLLRADPSSPAVHLKRRGTNLARVGFFTYDGPYGLGFKNSQAFNAKDCDAAAEFFRDLAADLRADACLE